MTQSPDHHTSLIILCTSCYNLGHPSSFFKFKFNRYGSWSLQMHLIKFKVENKVKVSFDNSDCYSLTFPTVIVLLCDNYWTFRGSGLSPSFILIEISGSHHWKLDLARPGSKMEDYNAELFWKPSGLLVISSILKLEMWSDGK